MAHELFISYAEEDKAIARELCTHLEHIGVRCWIAPRNIRPGSDWGASIVSAIRASRAMVVVFSRHANQSSHIPRELTYAIGSKIDIIPFRVEDIKPVDALEYGLGNLQWFDASSRPLEPHYQELGQLLLDTLRIGEGVAAGPDTPIPHMTPSRNQAALASPVRDTFPAVTEELLGEPVATVDATQTSSITNTATPPPNNVRAAPTFQKDAEASESRLHRLRPATNVASHLSVEADASADISTFANQRPTLPERTNWTTAGLGIVALLLAGLIAFAASQNTAVPNDLGFDPRGVTLMEITLPPSKYRTDLDAIKAFELLIERLKALPGVASVGAADVVPTSEGGLGRGVSVELEKNTSRTTAIRVLGNYFETLRILPVLGRSLIDAETSPVIVISDSVWSITRRDPAVVGLQATLSAEAGPPLTFAATVVGVLGGVRYRSEPADIRDGARVYVPATQDPVRRMTILARTSPTASPETMRVVLERVVNEFDNELPTPQIHDMEALVASSMSQPRFGTTTLTFMLTIGVALGGVAFVALKRVLSTH
jgi:hypothetical protein